ncbi:nucleoside deaminase [Chryseobacterium salipaludis]|uniref:nucleoside deaminase n=1 Tax=Chryseobacterium TaxID=59732 RepID=UPI001FF3276B|nr:MULTISPECIES: nucleoside deaminase [Chryseobacterium]MCJ8497444.1 nucleoside deaminase [Chryseobacterium salipaludis]MCX3295852.1 nucleoside deaminase [Planobacterium sp. JC490]
MLTNEYFMNLALQQAQMAAERGEVPVGCIVVANNTIIAKSHNLTEALNDVTAHAEMQAITSAAAYLGGKYLVNCTMYITLEPCVMCAGALAWSQISKVVIGARDEQRGYINKGLQLHPKTEVVTGVLPEKCSQLVKDFFRSRR